ncbi:MAG: hypothetical protein ACRC06_07445, partial [Waterburya sp.]
MYALRLMENWSHFTTQLPEPNLALQRIVAKPHLKLTASEHQLWDVADGTMSLLNIAKSTGQPLSIVQITAFRLISVGLVKEVFQSSYDWKGLSPQDAKKSLSSSRQLQQLPKLPSSNTSLLQSLGEIFKNTIS